MARPPPNRSFLTHSVISPPSFDALQMVHLVASSARTNGAAGTLSLSD
jgi:hypothetical protein